MPIFRPDLSGAKQDFATKTKDAIENGIKTVIGEQEKKAAPSAPEAKTTNPVAAKANEEKPAPAAAKKHRSILKPFGWRRKKDKNQGPELSAKK